MARTSKLKIKAKPKSNPGLGQAQAPILNKQNGEKIMAMSELDQLEDKRRGLTAQLEQVEGQILELKRKRREELMAELEALGLDETPKVRARATDGEAGKRRGRPKGFTMSDKQKQAMREGRAKAKAARQAGHSTSA